MEWDEKPWDLDSVNFFLRTNSTGRQLREPAAMENASMAQVPSQPMENGTTANNSGLTLPEDNSTEEIQASGPNQAVDYAKHNTQSNDQDAHGGSANRSIASIESPQNAASEKSAPLCQKSSQISPVPTYVRLPNSGANDVPVCQVDGCRTELSSFKEYYRRHRVCEMHAKVVKVLLGGEMQRFCQQCSRFHLLEEFDEGKRSCRRRLLGHNKRRRKHASSTSENVWSIPSTPNSNSSLVLMPCQNPGAVDSLGLLPSQVMDSPSINFQEAQSHSESSAKKQRHSSATWKEDLADNSTLRFRGETSSSLPYNNATVASTPVMPIGNSQLMIQKEMMEKHAFNSTPLFRGGPTLSPAELALLLPQHTGSSSSSYSASKELDPRRQPSHLQPTVHDDENNSAVKQMTASDSVFGFVENSRPNYSHASHALVGASFKGSIIREHVNPQVPPVAAGAKVDPLNNSAVAAQATNAWQSNRPGQVVRPGQNWSNQGAQSNQPVNAPGSHSMGLSLSLTTPIVVSQAPFSHQKEEFKLGYSSMGDSGSSVLTSPLAAPAPVAENTVCIYGAPETDVELDSTALPTASNLFSSSEDRTGRISFKLFDHSCDHLPKELKNQVMEWLAHRPSAVESYLRPGCVLLTLILRMPAISWMQSMGNLKLSLEKLVRGSGCGFWSRGAILVQFEHQMVFIHNGVIGDVSIMKSLSPPIITSVSPLCVVSGEETPISFKGLHLQQVDSRVICNFKGDFTVHSCFEDSHSLNNSKTEENYSKVISLGHVRKKENALSFDELKVKIKAGDIGQCGRAFFEVEHMVGPRSSNPWPLLVADSTVCAEIRTLEKYLNGRTLTPPSSLPSACADDHERSSPQLLCAAQLSPSHVLSLLHDLGWAFDELQTLRSLGFSSPSTESPGLTKLESEARIPFMNKFFDKSKSFSSDHASFHFSSFGSLSETSLKSVISFSVKNGWWATSRLLLDLALVRGVKQDDSVSSASAATVADLGPISRSNASDSAKATHLQSGVHASVSAVSIIPTAGELISPCTAASASISVAESPGNHATHPLSMSEDYFCKNGFQSNAATSHARRLGENGDAGKVFIKGESLNGDEDIHARLDDQGCKSGTMSIEGVSITWSNNHPVIHEPASADATKHVADANPAESRAHAKGDEAYPESAMMDNEPMEHFTVDQVHFNNSNTNNVEICQQEGGLDENKDKIQHDLQEQSAASVGSPGDDSGEKGSDLDGSLPMNLTSDAVKSG